MISARLATGRLQICHMISARLGVCRAIFFTIVLMWAFVGSGGFPRHTNQTDAQPEEWDFPINHSMEQMRDIHFIGDNIDLRINPNSRCNWDSCFNCTSSVRQTASKKGTPFTCEININVKNASCVFAQMSLCDNGGHSVCYNGPRSEPVCQCQDGWIGDRCQEVATQPVRCRCYKGGYKFCDQEKMVNCDNVHGIWSQCQKYGDNAGEELNCICQNSNNENGENEHILRMEEYDEGASCPWTSSSPVINQIY